jgi:hypothetical protein
MWVLKCVNEIGVAANQLNEPVDRFAAPGQVIYKWDNKMDGHGAFNKAD